MQLLFVRKRRCMLVCKRHVVGRGISIELHHLTAAYRLTLNAIQVLEAGDGDDDDDAVAVTSRGDVIVT